jgi:hypothetical protein
MFVTLRGFESRRVSVSAPVKGGRSGPALPHPRRGDRRNPTRLTLSWLYLEIGFQSGNRTSKVVLRASDINLIGLNGVRLRASLKTQHIPKA